MYKILILTDIRPVAWGIGFHAMVVFGLGKDFLLKSIQGRTAVMHNSHKILGTVSTLYGIDISWMNWSC